MISLLKFKEMLGEEARGLTDQEIKEIRDAQYKMAELAFEVWQKEKHYQKN